jgi:hypothetical protein
MFFSALFRSLFRSSRGFPFATNLSLVSIPIGLTAMILGPPVSRAFSILFHQPAVVYVWGVVLFLAGVYVAAGIGRLKPSMERAGLFVLAPAYSFYGVSVIIALGKGGLVTGPVFLALAVSCLQRARIISTAARSLSQAATVDEALHATNDVTKLP